MRVSQKMALIDQIGRALQARFSYQEIDGYLAEYKIKTAPVEINSKWVYAKAALHGVALETLVKIAEDLELDAASASYAARLEPRNWKGTTRFRLFISHISKDKDKARRLKGCLAPYAIGAFVAHEDIHPTAEWQREIERALYAMDAFLAMHTAGFKQSFWTQQEIGFAVARGVKIISLKMGEDPTGFISKHQALARGGRTAEQIAAEVDTLLAADEATAGKLDAAKKAERSMGDEIPF